MNKTLNKNWYDYYCDCVVFWLRTNFVELFLSSLLILKYTFGVCCFRYEELTELIKQIRNHKKIKDMAKILSTFENLTQAFTKAKPVIDKEEGGKVPSFYIRVSDLFGDLLKL